MIRKLFLVVLVLAAHAFSWGQGNQAFVAKSYYASDYGTWQVKGQQPNTYMFQPASLCQFPQPAGGFPFNAFNQNGPVYIADANPVNSEVVTPSFVLINENMCEVALLTTHSHYSFQLMSGTAGLQEVLNAISGSIAYPVEVVLDRNWYTEVNSLPGQTASAVIASVKGSNAAILVDQTTAPANYYKWNGTQYVVTSFPTTGLPLTGGTLSGALFAPDINNEVFPASCGGSSPPSWCTGTTADAWIRAACTQLSPGVGWLNLRGLSGNVVASATCSTPSKQVITLTDPTSALTITETDGGVPFPQDNNSMILGPGNGACISNAGFQISGTANIAGVIGPAHTDGTQEQFAAKGQCIYGHAGAVISKGAIFEQRNFANTTISDNQIFEVNGYGIDVINGGNIQIDHNWVNTSVGLTTITGSPIHIQGIGLGTGCNIQGVFMSENQFEHAYGGAPEVLIEGDGAGALVCNARLELGGTERNATNGSTIGIKIQDCWNCSVDHVNPSGTVGGTDLINVSQTASGRTQNVNITDQYGSPTWTNVINDTVTQPNVVLTAASTPQITTYYVAPGYASAGAPIGPASGGLTGTYPGPGLLPSAVVAAISGQPVTPSSVTSKIIDGVSNCAGYPGDTSDVQLKACVADAIGLANGNTTGWADARSMTGNLIMLTQVPVGNLAGNFVGLLLPCSGTWQWSTSDGTSVGIKHFGGAQIVGCPVSSASGLFYLGATTGSNLYAIYEQVGSASPYIYGQGFNVLNSSGHATASHYSAIVDGNPGGGSLSPFSDGSFMQSVNVNDFSNPSGGAILFRNVCCGYTWADSAFNANGGGTPVTIQADTNSYIQGLYFQNDTMVDPGVGKNAFLCTDTRSTHLSYVSIGGGPYNETSGSDSTTPLYRSDGCSQISFQNIVAVSNIANSTAPLISVSSAYSTFIKLNGSIQKLGTGTWTYPATVIVNAATGQTVMSDAAGNFGDYVTPTVPSNVGILTANTVTSDGGIVNAINAFSGTTLGYELNGGVVVGDATSNGNLLTDSVTNDVALINSAGSNKVLLGILANHSTVQINTSGANVTGTLTGTSTILGKHVGSNSSAPTIAAGTAAGTSPTIALVTANDQAGYITLTTGSTPAASATVATVTFNSAWAVAPKCFIWPANAATQVLTGGSAAQVFGPFVTTTAFPITQGSGALAAATAYEWGYQCLP